MLLTNQILVASVNGEVAESDGHSSDHLVRVGTQQLHQDGETFLLPHRGSDVVGPLEESKQTMYEKFNFHFLSYLVLYVSTNTPSFIH